MKLKRQLLTMRLRIVVLLLACWLPLLPSTVLAGPGGKGSGGQTSLDQAVDQVRRNTGGRVLSAETDRRGGHSVHRIKVLTPDGQVRYIQIDATGRGRGK